MIPVAYLRLSYMPSLKKTNDLAQSKLYSWISLKKKLLLANSSSLSIILAYYAWPIKKMYIYIVDIKSTSDWNNNNKFALLTFYNISIKSL